MFCLRSSFVGSVDVIQANVLIDEHFSVRLTDFGLAGIYGANTSTQGSGALGAIRICAPELVAQERCRPSFASDMYAFGCLCLEVMIPESS